MCIKISASHKPAETTWLMSIWACTSLAKPWNDLKFTQCSNPFSIHSMSYIFKYHIPALCMVPHVFFLIFSYGAFYKALEHNPMRNVHSKPFELMSWIAIFFTWVLYGTVVCIIIRILQANIVPNENSHSMPNWVWWITTFVTGQGRSMYEFMSWLFSMVNLTFASAFKRVKIHAVHNFWI